MSDFTTIDPRQLAHQLSKLDTEDLPVATLKQVIIESFLMYTTSDIYLGRTHINPEYSETVRESYLTLRDVCNFVQENTGV